MHVMFRVRPVTRAIWSMFGIPPHVHYATKLAVQEVMREQAGKLKVKGRK